MHGSNNVSTSDFIAEEKWESITSDKIVMKLMQRSTVLY